MEGVELISPIPKCLYEEVIVHLRNSYFVDEPQNQSLRVCEPGQSHKELESLCIAEMNPRLSVIAVEKETNKVVGLCLNTVFSPDYTKNERHMIKTVNDKKIRQLFTMFNNVAESLNMCERFQVDKLFYCHMGSVNANLRGKGLGKEIAKRCEEVARKHKFPIMMADASAANTQKILTSLGWEEIHRVEFSDFVDDDGEEIFKTVKPSGSLKIMVKILK